MAKVSIQIVTWNSQRYIFDCLESLMHQNFRDFSVVIIDNGSEDGTIDFVRAQYPQVSVIQNFKNLGFAKANNQGIQFTKSEYVLVMNPDVILNEDFLAKLVAFADEHKEAGSFGGKIRKLFSEAIDSEDQVGMRNAVKSDLLDSTGLEVSKSRKASNRGEGKKDQGQYSRIEEVFGNSGACILYRKEALEEVKVKNEYFDHDFFAYKEDVDLAWRLQLYGWKSWYVPTATCYHHRGFAKTEDKGLSAMVKARNSISEFRRIASFKNQHLMVVKNDQLVNYLLHLPWILVREVNLLFFSLFFERFQFKAIIKLFKQLPAAIIKRKVIMRHRKVSATEIRKWFK